MKAELSRKVSTITTEGRDSRSDIHAIEYIESVYDFLGWKPPLVLDENGMVIIGTEYYIEAKREGVERIGCFIAKDITDFVHCAERAAGIRFDKRKLNQVK